MWPPFTNLPVLGARTRRTADRGTGCSVPLFSAICLVESGALNAHSSCPPTHCYAHSTFCATLCYVQYMFLLPEASRDFIALTSSCSKHKTRSSSGQAAGRLIYFIRTIWLIVHLSPRNQEELNMSKLWLHYAFLDAVMKAGSHVRLF